MTNVNSPVTIAGVKLPNAVMNGAYVDSKTLDDVKMLAQSASGAVVVGSITVKSRQINEGGGYWLHREHYYTMNSFGLPNGGVIDYEVTLPKMVQIAHRHGKPLIANITPFTHEEFATLMKLAQDSGADLVELNLGCPNVWDGGIQEQIPSYHPQSIKKILDFIERQKFAIKLVAKISPLPPDLLRELADVLGHSKVVHAVTATNSYPNAALSTGIRKGPERDDFLAGMGGRALKPISLGVVKQLRLLLPQRIDIIGCGGIYEVEDAQDYLEAGAKAVQIASALVDEGPAIFDKILMAKESVPLPTSS